MKKKILFISFILSIANGYAQNNLVLNGSFENNINCPYGFTALTDGLIPSCSNPNGYSPDYYNVCSFQTSWQTPHNTRGWQYARTGNAYVGLGLWEKNANHSEYVQIKLQDSLKAEHHYVFDCFLSRAEKFRYATADFGVYFSNDSVSIATDILPFTPQINNPATNYLTDTTGWMPFTGTYQAHGGEKYLILGNFNNGTEAVDTLYQYFILNAANGYQQGPNCQNWAYYYIDDVSLIDLDSLVTVEEIGSVKGEVKLFPNPSNSTITLNEANKNDAVSVTDITGKIVMQGALQENKTIDISALHVGLYFIHLQSKKQLMVGMFVKE